MAAGPAPSRNARGPGRSRRLFKAPPGEQDESERRGKCDPRGQQPAGEPVRRVARPPRSVATTGPGVIWPSATALRNWALVIQWLTCTASPCISGMITKPPPNDSAPTFSAVHAERSDARPPRGGGRAVRAHRGYAVVVRRRANSTAPQASSTNTRYGPIEHRRGRATDDVHQPGGHSARGVTGAARKARARQAPGGMERRPRATAAPAPAPAPRTHSGGACPSTTADSARITHHGGGDEAEAADHRPDRAADAVGAVDGHLGRGRPGQQPAGRVGVLERVRVHPARGARP